ncbi:hypothetical protein HBP99_05785 [Listeria booriae]|uniref:ImmA/IrrE family metallo-endopeptidase n=1 Tax=Listeria booriae TaxID=1552123 RepID=UPI001626C4A5|nr:ImmA/IrrE family metallo-endopeptidase [Listeria booriae]MBC2368136.1 hypothetical protein [Listeria booriae]
MLLEKLCDEFPHLEIVLEDMNNSHKGQLIDRTVYLNREQTSTQLACTFLEEAMHDLYTVGDISAQKTTIDRKQEQFARRRAYDYLITFDDLADCYYNGFIAYHEAAEYLNISESFLRSTIAYYKTKYGLVYDTGKYIINIEPTINVFRADKNEYLYNYGC